jgi:uncharacterized protein (TIGR02246 family)
LPVEQVAVSALQEIDERRNRWIAAINAGDADSFVAVLVDDAVWLPWGQPAISGRDRIRDWLAGPFSEYNYEYSVDDVRIRVAGEWAVERASFRTRASSRSGAEAPIHEGLYTIIWRMSSRGWLIERYVDHTGFDAA